MHDKFRKKFKAGAGSPRLRQQIALEAAKRLLDVFPGDDAANPLGRLEAATESDYYSAKRKAAAVLGHSVRPGDLPSDDEVREQVVVVGKMRAAQADDEESEDEQPEPDDEEEPVALAASLDRFAVYRLRLAPLEAVKQNPKLHPEGDALYHSLQVFHLAREARPYDEEFLLAALLHDVGKAIDPRDHVAAAVEALRGAVTERTLWLVEHHMDLGAGTGRALNARQRKELDASEFLEDLKLLRELDDAARATGVVVENLDEALAYIKGLEHEAYLNE
ncbi:MAG: HD domain-containing protein [Paludisphaera borealis]|uniref:HD domain-containing protein n=1 Tax=Paludisphaera borealis TaxID=1387353 RepID=UPI00283E918E|nr:HD domain-containing protein [Paludisphaera borealis]MDR3620824.1 HD domain-containing protein [Paludisphaera borealis]